MPLRVIGEFEAPLLGIERFFRFEDKIIFEVYYSQVGAEGGKRIYSLVAPQRLDADIDGDGCVSFADFLILSSNFGKTDATIEEGDIDQDGTVGFADFLLLSKDFGKQASP